MGTRGCARIGSPPGQVPALGPASAGLCHTDGFCNLGLIACNPGLAPCNSRLAACNSGLTPRNSGFAPCNPALVLRSQHRLPVPRPHISTCSTPRSPVPADARPHLSPSPAASAGGDLTRVLQATHRDQPPAAKHEPPPPRLRPTPLRGAPLPGTPSHPPIPVAARILPRRWLRGAFRCALPILRRGSAGPDAQSPAAPGPLPAGSIPPPPRRAAGSGQQEEEEEESSRAEPGRAAPHRATPSARRIRTARPPPRGPPAAGLNGWGHRGGGGVTPVARGWAGGGPEVPLNRSSVCRVVVGGSP